MSALEQWTARFESLLETRQDPPWLTALRRRAWEHFLENGLPNRKNERWKYTSLRAFGRQDYVTPSREPLDIEFESDGTKAIATLSHVNGFAQLGGSDLGKLTPEIAIRPLAEAWDDAREALERRCDELRDGFEALQFAFAQDGAIVLVGNEVQMDAPIRLTRRTTTPNAFAPVFDVIVVGRHAKATLFERYEGSAEGATSGGFCDVVVKEGARLEHIIVQEEPEQTWHARITRVRIGRDAHYRAFTLAAGGRLGRHDHATLLDAPGGESFLDAITLGRGSQVLDHCTENNHVAPHTLSNQLCRAIVDGKAHSVFNGLNLIARDAQQVDIEQLNNNLLLSDDARADTRPQLEVAADDVKAGHGATLGRLDETEIFYLTSRAIPEQRARQLVIAGFAHEVVQRIESDVLRPWVTQRVQHWLEGAYNA